MARRIVVEFLGKDTSLGRTAEGVERKTSKVGGQLAKFGKVAAAGLAAGAAAAGVALFKIGSTFDDAYDTIRVGTGATGDALKGLQDDFKQVAANVPASMEDVSTSIADLNTRLGLSGKPLQELSGQMLNLSRITGTDLGTNIESVSRAFGDWGIETDDMAGAMDKLFRASQATGPSVDKIASAMTKYGSPLRQLGFDFEQTAALIGKFEKEGVNTGLVLGSMRQALGKMAREGEPAQETLERVTKEIKNAGSVSEANAKALELFGARAGPDMAAAIREGRFELGDLYKTVKSGTETITKASDDTASFSEKWQMLKNRALIALEPLAIRVFDAIGNGMDKLLPALSRFSAYFSANIAPAIARVIPHVRAFGDYLGKVLPPIFEQVRSLFSGSLTGMAGDAGSKMAQIKQVFTDAVSIVTSLWNAFGANIVQYARSAFQNIIQVLSGAFDVISGLFKVVSSLLKGDWKGVWKGIQTILRGAVKIIVAVVKQLWNVIRFAFKNGGTIVKGVFRGLWSAVQGLARAGVNGIVSAVKNMPRLLLAAGPALLRAGKSLMGKIFEGFKKVGSIGLDIGRNLFNGVVDGINKAIDGVNNFLPNKIPLKGLPDIDLPDNPIPRIPRLASGASAFGGGLATVGEHGRELTTLPGGTRVYPHHRTEAMYASARRGAAAASGGNTIINIYGALDPVAVGRQVEKALVKYTSATGRPVQVRTL